MVHILQLTDTHLYAGSESELCHVKTRHSLQAVLQHVRHNIPKIDIVLVTGDLVHDESNDGYKALKHLMLSMDKPIHYIPGNHDDPEAMSQVLENYDGSGFQAIEYENWSVVLLDSSLRGCVDGEIAQDCLDRFVTFLEEHPDSLVLVALHHHVLDIHSPWLDALNLRNGKEFMGILERYSQVKVVINGHIHQELDETRNTVRYLGTPSTCFQFAPRQEKAAIDDKPPGYRYLALGDDGSVETQVFYVEGYS